MKKKANKSQTNYFDKVHEHIDRGQHRLADFLSLTFRRLSPRARKAVLMIIGLLIAAVCFDLTFGLSTTIHSSRSYFFHDAISRPLMHDSTLRKTPVNDSTRF